MIDMLTNHLCFPFISLFLSTLCSFIVSFLFCPSYSSSIFPSSLPFLFFPFLIFNLPPLFPCAPSKQNMNIPPTSFCRVPLMLLHILWRILSGFQGDAIRTKTSGPHNMSFIRPQNNDMRAMALLNILHKKCAGKLLSPLCDLDTAACILLSEVS